MFQFQKEDKAYTFWKAVKPNIEQERLIFQHKILLTILVLFNILKELCVVIY